MSKKIHKNGKRPIVIASPWKEVQRTSVKKVKESEAFFRLFVEGARDYAMLIISRDGIITNWNKGGENLFGYTEEEILGHNFSLLITLADRNLSKP